MYWNSLVYEWKKMKAIKKTNCGGLMCCDKQCVTCYPVKEHMTLKETNEALNKQEGGNHYKGYAIQPVEFAMSNNLDLCQANVVKYTVRFRDKGGVEDLRKARHYLELLAKFEYNEEL